nr:reverse transcriptase domain-containing protein [Tanacetum cinerariifolium]
MRVATQESQGGMKFKENDLKIKIQGHRRANNESKEFLRTRLQVSRKITIFFTTEITMIMRKANETLVAFNERWIVETGFITRVPELMKLSSFMDAHKCPELAKRYFDKVPKTVDEMMTRLDDFVRSEEAFASTKLPKGEASKAPKKSTGPVSRREDQFHKGGYRADSLETTVEPAATKADAAPTQERKSRQILQRGQGNAKRKDAEKDKVINIIRSWSEYRKRKSVERDESLMKAPIVFPPLLMEDASDELLIIEAVMEGYLVRRVYVDQGASVENGFKIPLSGFLDNTRHGKVPYPKGDRDSSHSVDHHFRVPEVRKEANGQAEGQSKYQPRERSPRKSGFDRTNLGQPGILGSAGNDRGKPARRIILEHSLNVNPSIEPVAQKRRVLASDRTQVVIKEVEEWMNTRIVCPVRYPTWISNPVLMKKSDGRWRMCIDFKNLNPTCPKDYYPLLNVQMAQDNEGKIAFYTDQGTYCYTKMPFGIKNAGATYQRINMKLNPKRCSSRVEEGKFLGYMVTSEGIRANLKKTKAIADMKSPRTLKEMQSLSGKLAALKRFLSRFTKKSLPFFKTLKDITKENKDESRWTESAEKAFQEMKKVILKEETLYVYVAEATEAASVILLTKRKGKQCPIHYVRRKLNEVGKNYASLEKLALSMLHMSRRLRRYFEAHPIKVITDQPLKQILNKAQTSRNLGKYSVELGAYNITYEPRNAIKGQHLADFLSEAPVGIPIGEFFRLPAKFPNKDDVKRWTLFTDGASNSKGSGAGLVLISPSGVEFAYALRLNFTNTNNEA